MLNTEIMSVINDEITRTGYKPFNIFDQIDRVKYVDVYHGDICIAYYHITSDDTIVLREDVAPTYNAEVRRYSLSQPNAVSLLARQIHEWTQGRLLRNRNVPK